MPAALRYSEGHAPHDPIRAGRLDARSDGGRRVRTAQFPPAPLSSVLRLSRLPHPLQDEQMGVVALHSVVLVEQQLLHLGAEVT